MATNRQIIILCKCITFDRTCVIREQLLSQHLLLWQFSLKWKALIFLLLLLRIASTCRVSVSIALLRLGYKLTGRIFAIITKDDHCQNMNKWKKKKTLNCIFSLGGLQDVQYMEDNQSHCLQSSDFYSNKLLQLKHTFWFTGWIKLRVRYEWSEVRKWENGESFLVCLTDKTSH